MPIVGIYVKLKEIREARGFSQEGLARAVGVSLNTMQRWEYNLIRSASFDTLEKLCEVLECKVEDLLEWRRTNS
ncbi:XRE family transcriptional regulator (plasmid) [Calothrix sp. NIES-4071]|nr:XRE family transcriptional regulator [Calothrix sp. NIES-4071]BAZ65042.1 XRE family transcriptional regulator [Calothrix sp. NIES-4105]